MCLLRSERNLSLTQAEKFVFFLANSHVVASREIVIGLILNPILYVRIVFGDREVLASVFLILCSLYFICSVRVVGRGESSPRDSLRSRRYAEVKGDGVIYTLPWCGEIHA